jgi:hypothetical protein
MLFCYTAFNFDIQSDLALPAHQSVGVGEPMLTIQEDKTLGERPWTGFDFRMSNYLEFSILSSERWLLRCYDEASGREALLEIDAAGFLRWFCRGGYLQGDLSRLIVYQGLPALVLLRGSAVLHGAMFEHNDAGFAIVGASGRGKSTTTAALLCAGAGLVAEETLVLRESTRGTWSVLPGLPHLALSRSLAARMVEREILPEWEREHAGEEKVRWRWHTEQSASPRRPAPIQALLVLEPREPQQRTWSATRLAVPTAIYAAGQHGYWSAQLPAQYRAASYRAALQIASSVPVFRLTLPDGVDRLFDQAPALLHSLGELMQPVEALHG